EVFLLASVGTRRVVPRGVESEQAVCRVPWRLVSLAFWRKTGVFVDRGKESIGERSGDGFRERVAVGRGGRHCACGGRGGAAVRGGWSSRLLARRPRRGSAVDSDRLGRR